MYPHAFAYQDDIKVIGRILEGNKRNLREVFRRLKEAKMRLKPEKCQILKKELLYLGHRVTSEGIGTGQEKEAGIAVLELPSTVKELRPYLGVAPWYRRFVPHFSRIVKPLNDLLRLVADLVLVCPYFSRTTPLECLNGSIARPS